MENHKNQYKTVEDTIRPQYSQRRQIELVNTLDFTHLVHPINCGVTAQRLPSVSPQ